MKSPEKTVMPAPRAESGPRREGLHSPTPLKVLVVEDSENDALLLELELERSGYAPDCVRVDSPEELEAALGRQIWDVVIADYVLPRLNGLDALTLLKSHGLDVPFIIVSGHITDDTAVAAMKAGAHDYVMKDNLARLGPAVQRELREVEERRQRRRAAEQLKVEQVFRLAVENSVPSGIVAIDLEGRQTYVNPAFCRMVGWTESELLGARPPFVYWPPEQFEAITEAFTKVIQGAAPPSGTELRFRRRTGEQLDVLLQTTPLKDLFGNISGWVSSVSDITERKRAEVRLAGEHTITRLLVQAQTLQEAAPGVLATLVDSLEMEVGLLWLPDPNDTALHFSLSHLRVPSAPQESFVTACRSLQMRPGLGLPGRVWKSKRPEWLEDFLDDENVVRKELALKSGLRTGMAFPIQSAGRVFGVLEFFAVARLPREPSLVNMVSAIGSEMGQFLERRSAEDALRRAHDELEVRVQHRTAELKAANAKLHTSIAERKRLENELLEITEKERRRIALDLHDDLGQRLSGIALMTKGLELKLGKEKAAAARDAAKIHGLVQEAMNHAREVAQDLATLDLAHKGLPEALGDLAVHARKMFRIDCDFTCTGTVPALDANVVTQLYKIAQEAVTNAIKHGKTKKVDLALVAAADQLALTIQNTGVPFPDLRSHSTGMGLRIMNYRASLIGGSLEIRSLNGKGTRVSCSVPLEKR